jgi:hypothetical protein
MINKNWCWRHQVFLKCWYLCDKIHGVASKKMLIFIVTGMRMSYLKMYCVLHQVLGSVVGISVSHVLLEEDDSCKYILQSDILLNICWQNMNKCVIQLCYVQDENISSTCIASDSVLNTLETACGFRKNDKDQHLASNDISPQVWWTWQYEFQVWLWWDSHEFDCSNVHSYHFM